MNDSPAVILYDQNGNPVHVAREETLLTMARGDVRHQKRYDIRDDVIYTGYADPGTAPDASAWTIKRVIMEDGSPVSEAWTNETAVWDGREAETYT